MTGIFDMLRRMITLILFGLLLGWLFPLFLKNAVGQLQSNPLPLFGWGLVTWAAFFFAILFLIVATTIGAVIFGALTLSSISSIIVGLGVLLLFALIIGFSLASAQVAQIICSQLGGKLLLAQIKPEWSEHKTWPLIVGVIIFAILASIPFIGWLINLIAVLFGLGALWVMGRDFFKTQQQASALAVGS